MTCSPTTGSIRVFGAVPASSTTQLERVGFVAQDTPVYAGFSVHDHLRYGKHVNPKWDDDLAKRGINLGLDLRQRAAGRGEQRNSPSRSPSQNAPDLLLTSRGELDSARHRCTSVDEAVELTR